MTLQRSTGKQEAPSISSTSGYTATPKTRPPGPGCFRGDLGVLRSVVGILEKQTPSSYSLTFEREGGAWLIRLHSSASSGTSH